MRIFLILFTLSAIAIVGLFSLVHGDPRPQLEATYWRAKPDVSRLPDPRDVIPIEPAQPEGAGIHKCVKRGKISYTDQPCPADHDQRALDPERSKIVTLPAQKPAAPAGAPAARPAPGGIDIADDGSIRRTH
ncbi:MULTISPECIES: hypothetical protein [Niveibacterium]|uniref:DUF4124 domain-containing protein n=1 Tax=Niveibacterium microcysteis TaxID=2811415 RepID=A0ABX7M6I3_9RHOO|nr:MULTISPECIES: hypothetical protein [Niveibacterium]QSI77363.1 hypothetical protein JY500_01530 [Niveibacterium microcysteis]